MRKRILTILIAFVMMTAFVPWLNDNGVVYAADDYPGKYKNAAKDTIVDEWRFWNRECTSFVAWCLNSRNGVSFTNTYGGVTWGDAGNWGNAARSIGIAVDNNPVIGSVAWWSSGHVGWVSAVNGNSVTTEEYNWNYDGAYHTRTQDKSTISGFIHIKDLGANGPTACLSVERKYYNPGDTVTFHFSGENTSGQYTLGIYKEFDRYKTVDVRASSYSIVLNDIASYSAYMTSYGTGGGLADSNWVDWQVLPLTAELKADKTKCNVNDKVTLSFAGNNSNTFAGEAVTLAVWCNDEYVVHENVSAKNYVVKCDKPGKYKAYMTAYGGGTYKDSNWINWTVYPLTAELMADKTKCNVNDKVTLSFAGNNSNTFAGEAVTLAVWCNDEYVVHENVSAKNYVVKCDKPGKYKAYMTAYGTGGGLADSNWVDWQVLPLTAELTPKLYLSRKTYTWNNKVQTPKIAVKAGSKTLPVSCYKVTLQKGRKNVGTYTIKVTLKNGYSGTRSASYTIKPKGTGLTGVTAASKAATVKWAKQAAKMSTARITGYQIQYSLRKDFKSGNKAVNVGGYTKTSRKITGLASKKTYYFRVRTYLKSGSKTYYSGWSKARAVKVK